jgi:hypothetical protein
MELFSTGASSEKRLIGRVRENFSPFFSKCCAARCLGTVYHDVDTVSPSGGFETKYTLRANLACCGRVNNACRKDNVVFDILDTSGNVVAHLQKAYARGDGAYCR